MAQTKVQATAVQQSGNGNTNTSAGSITVSGGNTLAVAVTWGNAATATATLSDGTNTYTGHTRASNGGADGICVQWFTADNITGGTFTLTLTLTTNADRPSIFLYEFSGDSSPAFDTQATGTGSDAAPTPGSITTAQADEAILTVARNLWGNAYTAGAWGATLDSGDFRTGCQSKLVTGIQSGLVCDTVQSGANQWSTAVLTLKEVGGGGGGGATNHLLGLLGVGA